MSLATASGAAILRGVQKDDYFNNRLTANISEVLRLTGAKTWNKYSQYTPIASKIAYGSLTTLKDLQTLGEEYTGIIQVDDTYTRLPSKLYQLLAIVFGACGETVLKNALGRLKSKIKKNDELLPNAKVFLLKLTLVAQWSLPIVKDLHQAWFYIGGQHYDISKRLTGINYVNAVPGGSLRRDMLRPLGIPCLVRGILNAIRSPPSFEEIDIDKQVKSVAAAASCSGCLDENLAPCALPCGHILCNKCARGSSACALCRAPYTPDRTVPLQNYKL